MIDDTNDPDDVDCGLEPTAGMMRRFYRRDPDEACCNVLRVIVADGPASFSTLRASVLHSERSVSHALAALAVGGFIERDGRTWRLTEEASPVTQRSEAN